MKLKKFLIDQLLAIMVYMMGYFIILMMLIAFKMPISLNIVFSCLFLLLGMMLLLMAFFRKKKFYDELIINTSRLDQKYLVLETLERPFFYEGNLIYDLLYDINKSMLENVNGYSLSINDFKEYVEMWIHEVKIPISSLILMCHNNRERIDRKYINQLRRLDDYIDQILYYVRSEDFEKDFLIKDVKLERVISNVALKNKDDLLENKIDLEVNLKNINVLTDAKWLEFILNQIINNSIKYRRDNVDSFIKIYAVDDYDRVILTIYDNGIGIKSSDLPRVFNKSFTGENGRRKTKSTGIGLYITKKLCDKLGHSISINSEVDKFTEVKIIFSKNDFYKFKD